MTSDPLPSDEAEEEPGDAGAPSEPESEYPDLPPWSIWVAVRLMWAGAGLSLLVLGLGFLTVGSIKDKIAAQLREQHTYSPHNVDNVFQNLVVSTVIASLLAAVLWFWMAGANGAGKRWARTVSSFLGALNITQFGLSFTADGVTVPELVVTGLNVVLAVAVLGLLWHPDSTDYYWLKSKRG